LAGELGTAWVKGVQSQGVGTSLKHFAANNQEDDRMRVSSNVDERTLREIYLRPFQKVVTQAQPWTVMCSYNKVNGTYASENPWLLTKVLRDEWGFEGFVVSDWGAVANRVNAVKAGLDLQMPYDGGTADQELTAALDSGEIDRATAQQAAERVARIADRVAESRREGFAYDVDAHHGIAREAAARAIVLLKNEGDILPLTTDQRITPRRLHRQPPPMSRSCSSVLETARNPKDLIVRTLSSPLIRSSCSRRWQKSRRTWLSYSPTARCFG
jgi:beta-glucosidase